MLASALEFIQSAWWVVTLPGPGDPGHGARVQPDRRRPARRARSEAEAMACRRSTPLLDDRRTLRGRAFGGARATRPLPSRSTTSTSRSTPARWSASSANRARARASRRSRVMGLIDAPGRVRAERLAFDGRDLQAMADARAARAARRRHRDDLPGPDRRASTRRFTVAYQLDGDDARCTKAARARRGARARCELLKEVEIPDAGAPPRRLSAPALGRHEPARDDRDGDRLQPAPADRRRADHRARRHGPGADAGPAAAPAARARHGAAC